VIIVFPFGLERIAARAQECRRRIGGRHGDEICQFAGAFRGPVANARADGKLRSHVPESKRMPRSIAIVEDEPLIRANYVEALARLGYEVRGYASRADAESAFAQKLPELVIIDVGLGDEPDGGFELCRGLRAKSATLPILFLTARDSDFDVIAGLRLGADDYLAKDVSLHQLAARISALFRRMEALKKPAAADNVIAHGPLRIETERMRVTWNGADVPLTVTEFWMVHTLVRFPGHVKNRDQLMRDAQVVVDDATITSHIKRIRKKFVAVDPAFDAIDTVHGAGYRWRA
jgi:two-component system OmpR family response regulator